MADILFRTQKVIEMGGDLLKSLRRHRTQQREEQEVQKEQKVVERRLKKYTTDPLPKLPKKEEKEKDGNNI